MDQARKSFDFAGVVKQMRICLAFRHIEFKVHDLLSSEMGPIEMIERCLNILWLEQPLYTFLQVSGVDDEDSRTRWGKLTGEIAKNLKPLVIGLL